MEELNANQLVVVNNGVPQVQTKLIDDLLDEIESAKAFIEEKETLLKSELLKALTEHSIESCETDKRKISQVIPKSQWIFDDEAFIKNENEDLVLAYSKLEETEIFDLEKFKAEQPEMYKKYCTVESKVVINESKLWKDLVSIWKKYATEVMSTKPTTLKIMAKKVK